MSDSSPRTAAAGLRSHSTELGLALAILIVLGLTAALDRNHSYWTKPAVSSVDILRQTVMLGIFALGSSVIIISGGIDLSSGSMIAFSGTTCATLMLVLNPTGMQEGNVGTLNISLAIAGTLLVGFLVGSLHAWLITVIGLPPFVATLATLVGLRSLGRAMVENVTLSYMGGRSTQIQIFDKSFRSLASMSAGSSTAGSGGPTIWIPPLVFLALVAFFWVLMSRTVTGRHLYAMGGNEAAARLSGIRTDRLKWFAYCLGSLCSTIAGILYIGDQSVADPQTLGRGYELNAIAAAVVGGCSLQGGIGTIPGVVLGCLFLRVVMDGIAKIIKTGADVYEGLIVGIVVVVAVAFSQLRGARGHRSRFFPGALGWVAAVTLSLLTGLLLMLVVGKVPGITGGFVALAMLCGIKLRENLAAR
jgi:ribose/xylose/arabinose/galactoside ABC-type transport system permease subunit